VTQVRNPLESFELDDTHLLTGDTAVAQITENILLEFDPALPLELDLIPPGIESDFRALLLVVPTNRKMDF
jgi:hypothetical protein